VIAGDTRSFGYGLNDIYLIKLDTEGRTLWTKVLGGRGWDEANALIETTDGGLMIVGATSSHGAGDRDVYLVRTDAAGDTLWTRTYGGAGFDSGNAVEQVCTKFLQIIPIRSGQTNPGNDNTIANVSRILHQLELFSDSNTPVRRRISHPSISVSRQLSLNCEFEKRKRGRGRHFLQPESSMPGRL